MIDVTHGGWIPVRKDFVDPGGTRCHARAGRSGRHHGFPHGHAFILRDAAGHEYPFGAECARALLDNPALLEQVPDYTERDAVQRLPGVSGGVSDSASEGVSGGAPGDFAGEFASEITGRSAGNLSAAPRRPRRVNAEQEALRRRNAATRYVVLRMEKVAAVPRVQPTVRFAALEALYQQVASGHMLTGPQVQRVLAIERSAATPPKLKSVNLLDVYTAHIKLEWLIAASNNVENIRFLRSLHDWLARHLVLSAAQIAAAGIVMHPHAFRSAWPVDGGAGGPGELF